MVISLSIKEHAGIRLIFCDVHHYTYVHKHNIIIIRTVSTFLGQPVYSPPTHVTLCMFGSQSPKAVDPGFIKFV
jgi:hypothetical protein